jgi:hypothetical protein
LLLDPIFCIAVQQTKLGLELSVAMEDFKFNVPVPYNIDVDRELLEVTKQKLALARYPTEQDDIGEDSWAQGAKVTRVRQLAQFWQTEYNWDEEEVSRLI